MGKVHTITNNRKVSCKISNTLKKIQAKRKRKYCLEIIFRGKLSTRPLYQVYNKKKILPFVSRNDRWMIMKLYNLEMVSPPLPEYRAPASHIHSSDFISQNLKGDMRGSAVRQCWYHTARAVQMDRFSVGWFLTQSLVTHPSWLNCFNLFILFGH